MSKSSATKIYATAAAALAVKEFFQKILVPTTTSAFNPKILSSVGCFGLFVNLGEMMEVILIFD